jgi:hypothetical protein
VAPISLTTRGIVQATMGATGANSTVRVHPEANVRGQPWARSTR